MTFKAPNLLIVRSPNPYPGYEGCVLEGDIGAWEGYIKIKVRISFSLPKVRGIWLPASTLASGVLRYVHDKQKGHH